jgi:hypothetical protein
VKGAVPPAPKVRLRREYIKTLLARAVPIVQIAKECRISERTARGDVAAIRKAAAEELLERPVARYAADIEREFNGVRQVLLRQFHEAGDRNDDRAVVLLARAFHENREKGNALLQSLGVVYRAPAQLMAALRLETAIDEIPENVLRTIAEAPSADKAMELFVREVGEERAKLIFEHQPERKLLTSGSNK